MLADHGYMIAADLVLADPGYMIAADRCSAGDDPG